MIWSIDIEQASELSPHRCRKPATAERTICLDIDGFVAQFGPKHRARNGGQYAPLQQVLQIIRFTFHLLLFVLCVFVCAGVRITPCS